MKKKISKVSCRAVGKLHLIIDSRMRRATSIDGFV